MPSCCKSIIFLGFILFLTTGAGCSFSADSVKIGNTELGPISRNIGDVPENEKQTDPYLDKISLGRHSESNEVLSEETVFARQDRVGVTGQAHNLKADSKLIFFISNSDNNEIGRYELPVTQDMTETPFYYNYKFKDPKGYPIGKYAFHIQLLGADEKQIGEEIIKEFTINK